MALTMTAEREAEVRVSMTADYDYGPEEQKSGEGQELLAELDAERAAHQETQAKLAKLDSGFKAIGYERENWADPIECAIDAARCLKSSNDVMREELVETQAKLDAARKALRHAVDENGFGYTDCPQCNQVEIEYFKAKVVLSEDGK